MLSTGLTFIQTQELFKTPILEAVIEFVRKLKIKIFFWFVLSNFNKNKTYRKPKSNWVPGIEIVPNA